MFEYILCKIFKGTLTSTAFFALFICIYTFEYKNTYDITVTHMYGRVKETKGTKCELTHREDTAYKQNTPWKGKIRLKHCIILKEIIIISRAK